MHKTALVLKRLGVAFVSRANRNNTGRRFYALGFIAPMIRLALAFAFFNLPAAAQPAADAPAVDYSERAAILEAVRQILQEQLKQPVRICVEHLKLQSGWAFLQARPQRSDGQRLDYRGTPYQTAVEAGAFDESVHALLRKERKEWKVVAFDFGATDVVWEPWPNQYKAPRKIFPPGGSE